MTLTSKILLRKLHQKLFGPIWVKYPETIMLDTHNFCNLDCQYCNPQHSFNLPRGKMETETIESILKYFGNRLFFCVAPFMNGEPMLDDRLPEICSMVERYNKTQCVIDTNGTVYEKRQNLIHRNLRLVRFTISAITSETYERVHGKPYFEKAMATFEWFQKNKLPTQTAWLHFIVCKDNEHEIEQWTRHFNGAGRTVFPVHRSPIYKKDSEKAKGEKVTEPYFIFADGTKKLLHSPPSKYKPCPNWDILAISWNGKLLQCCDFPYQFNYGRVGEVDLLEAWQERLRNKMDNPCCSSCNLRFPNWKQTINRWIK